MATIGLGEALAITSLCLQLVDSGKRCLDFIKVWKDAGADAEQLYLKFNHEQRKFYALKNMLVTTNKLSPSKSLFELMEPERQADVRDMLLHLLQLLNTFEKLSTSYSMSQASAAYKSGVELPATSLDTLELRKAIPNLEDRVRGLHTRLRWTSKLRWSMGGRADATGIVATIREWLDLIKEEIEQSFWYLSTSGSDLTIKHLNQLESDQDIETLQLKTSVRMRKLVFEFHGQSRGSNEVFPDHLDIRASSVDLNNQPDTSSSLESNDGTLMFGKWKQSTGALDVLVEITQYTRDKDEVQRKMQSLCQLLTEKKDEGFRLPRASGLMHFPDESDPRLGTFGLVFPLRAFGARTIRSVWSLDKAIQTLEVNRPRELQRIALESKFALARSLAIALARLHSIGWYHEGLHRTTICLSISEPGPKLFERPYLLGFAASRAFGAKTWGDSAQAMLSRLHLHPARAALMADQRAKHEAIHDLYVLGVVLLEIGLWKPIESIIKSEKPISTEELFMLSQKKPDEIQKILLKAADSSLEQVMGTRYRHVVTVLIQATLEEENSLAWTTASCQKRLLRIVQILMECYSGIELDLQNFWTTPSTEHPAG